MKCQMSSKSTTFLVPPELADGLAYPKSVSQDGIIDKLLLGIVQGTVSSGLVSKPRTTVLRDMQLRQIC